MIRSLAVGFITLLFCGALVITPAASRSELQPDVDPPSVIPGVALDLARTTGTAAGVRSGTPRSFARSDTLVRAPSVASRRTRPAALSDPRYPAPRRSTRPVAPRKRLVASVRTSAATVEARYGVPWLARSGIASHMGNGYPAGYLALPHGPGWRARICGAGGCVVMVSNDAGPSLAMQREGRVADLSTTVFEAVCGVPASAGLCPVSVTILGRA